MKNATGTIRRRVTIAGIVVFVGSIALWIAGRERLPRVIRIKLTILHGFTAEEVRGDQSFRIVLNECGNRIENLRRRLPLARSG